ncbi:MAG: coproporphyrinogen dehydrogenase HemZ [Christensenellales bacterium]|jgi:coproporphyrinogen dehydrogenase HemZ
MKIITPVDGLWNELCEVVRAFGYATAFVREGEDGCTLVHDARADGDGVVHTAVLSRPDGSEVRAEARQRAVGQGAVEQKRLYKRAAKKAVYELMRGVCGRSLPWGALTGIRPVKLARDLADQVGERAAYDTLRNYYDVSPEKARLALDIASVQRPLMAQRDKLDVYIGIPFCRTRCLYCSFAAVALDTKHGKLAQGYADWVIREMRASAPDPARVRAVYVGGGTPTALPVGELAKILQAARDLYGDAPEFTVEAGRPDGLDADMLRMLHDKGVSRVSINPQTFSDATLARIGRAHRAQDILRAFELARSVGFTCINMDLIAGLPGETPEDMARSLREVERLAPENLTVHTLAVKRGSRLHEFPDRFPLPSGEDVSEMVRMGFAAAARMGMAPYYLYRQKYMAGNLENVGYALPGAECLYNIDIMEETHSILAYGAGAISKKLEPARALITRQANPRDIPLYGERVNALAQEKRALFAEVMA